MEAVLTYRGRQVTAEDLRVIRELLASGAASSRRALSLQLCEAWNWRQANGSPCDAVCRSMLLELERAGHIELPPPQWTFRGTANRRRRRPAAVEVEESPLSCSLSELGPLSFTEVRRSAAEALCDGLIESHHYLGYVQGVGEQLKFLVTAGERPVACFVWGSAARHLGPRDRFIGWSPEARRCNIRFIAYNSRFLILPWVAVPHLASHLLGRMTRMLPSEWERRYHHPVYFAETFVDPSRFRGTCYRAANWVWLGQTTGRGKNDQTNRPNRPLKDVLGFPLRRDFRARLVRV